MAVLTAIIGTFTAYGAALVTARSHMPKWCKGIIEGIALVTNTIPGMVLGVAYMFVFSGTSLQNTMWILLICNVIHYFSSPYLLITISENDGSGSFSIESPATGESY